MLSLLQVQVDCCAGTGAGRDRRRVHALAATRASLLVQGMSCNPLAPAAPVSAAIALHSVFLFDVVLQLRTRTTDMAPTLYTADFILAGSRKGFLSTPPEGSRWRAATLSVDMYLFIEV